MKIWLEISNSPHINLFSGMISDLQCYHEVVVTSRPLANTVALLDLHEIVHTVVGNHYTGTLAKSYGYPVRIFQLWSFLKDKKIDVAISQSSFHSPVVARMLGLRSIYMNDNEHALGNIPAFAAATKILVPEFLSAEHLRRQYARRSKIVRYPGVKEGIYLHRLESALSLSKKAHGQKTRRTAYVRPEPWTAQYYKGRTMFLDDLLLGLKNELNVTLLPRDNEQREYYGHPRFQGLRVVTGALDIEEIAPDCDLFVGAGGTMTREMAVLGIPTISVYQDELLDVDRYLLSENAFLHRPSLTATEALQYLEHSTRRPPNRELLQKGQEAYEMIKSAIVNG